MDSLKGKCVKSSIQDANLDYCNQYDYSKNVCVKCAEGAYFDADNKCQKYSDVNCKTPSTDLKTCS